MQGARRLVSVVAVVGLVTGFALTLLPVSISTSFGPAVGCDPAGMATVGGGSTVGLSHYVSAFEVWLMPDSVNPPQTESTTYNPAADASICRNAAQNQMIPALILLGVGVFLLAFRRVAARYLAALPTLYRHRPALSNGPPTQ